MALESPPGLDLEALRRGVDAEYTRLAEDPAGRFHFNRGRGYAVELLRYDGAELLALPEEAVERFAGIGNPLRIAPLHEGETVVDVGCGAGTDLLLAARRVGREGHVIGVEPTPALRAQALENARRAGLEGRVELRDGHATDLPVADASVDVVISNGVLNLTPDKRRSYGEIARILKPGGRLLLADVAVRRDLSLQARSDLDLWAA
jgi:SAM-dependent methyltransferase